MSSSTFSNMGQLTLALPNLNQNPGWGVIFARFPVDIRSLIFALIFRSMIIRQSDVGNWFYFSSITSGLTGNPPLELLAFFRSQYYMEAFKAFARSAILKVDVRVEYGYAFLPGLLVGFSRHSFAGFKNVFLNMRGRST